MRRSTIGGQLDLTVLSRLAGDPDMERLRHFATLGRQQQAQGIRRLASVGWSDSSIAAVTGLSIEQVCRIMAEPRPTVADGNRGANLLTGETTS